MKIKAKGVMADVSGISGKGGSHPIEKLSTPADQKQQELLQRQALDFFKDQFVTALAITLSNKK